MGWESTSRPSQPAFKRPNIPRCWNRQEKKLKQEKSKNVQSIPKTVWLLEGPEDVSCDWENSLTEDSILVRAEINLKSDNNLEEIRGELQAVIEKPYPTDDMYDFEFVKREHNVIITPVTMSNIYVEAQDCMFDGKLTLMKKLQVKLMTNVRRILQLLLHLKAVHLHLVRFIQMFTCVIPMVLLPKNLRKPTTLTSFCWTLFSWWQR